MQEEYIRYTADLVDSRLARGSTQPDIWNLVLNTETSEALAPGKMHSCAELFIISGSETTATLLCDVIYYLLCYPSSLKKLVDEIRSRFVNFDSITFERLSRLRYLNACLEEALRLYSPVLTGVARVAPPGGLTILFKWVAPGTRVSVRQPDAFVPERWLGDHPAYRSNNRDCCQPYSVETRNFIDQNMAWHETRLILAKLLFTFDLELCEKSTDWISQKTYALWEKKPLMFRMRTVT
ncbi:cytochrome P450 [Apiospora rasikravindrae]|uniref:Cytochrome P450 n=1 Tax=Apiospora rasikravindrae TaxID=990691 RepID=A0ABR1S3L6_9PEZI